MSALVWTCQNGTVFSSEANGLRLVIARAPIGNGYRYQLLRQMEAAGDISVASGYREELRDAIEAAERVARGFAAGGRHREPAGVFAP